MSMDEKQPNDKRKLSGLLRRDYTLSLFNKAYSIVIGVVSSAFYVRYLGLEYKGTYSYINEIATIIALIINFGIYQSYPFYFRKKGHEIYEKYVNTFLLQFLLYLLVSTAVLPAFQNNIVIVFVCLQLPFLVLKTQLDNVVLVEKIRLYMWVDMALKTVLAIIYFLLWMFAPVQIGYLVACIAVTNLIVCVVYIYATGYKLSLRSLIPDLPFIKEVVKFGFFPMLSALLMTLNYSVDIIFLKNMGDPVELSLYSVAAVIINYVWVIPNAFKEVLISRVARSESDDQVAFSTKISLLVTLVCLAGFAILGKLAIRIVFGADFIGCYLVTIVLFIGAFSMIFFKMLGVVFVAEGKQKEYFVILLISVIANLIANFLLIPIWGMYGAAIASVASYTICGFAFLLSYCKWKDKKMRRYIFVTREDIRLLLKKKTKEL